MPKKRRSCKNNPDRFCCICGQLTLLKYLRNLTDKIKRLYYAYCGCAVGDQDWSPFIFILGNAETSSWWKSKKNCNKG